MSCFPQVDPVSSRLSDIVILEYCWLLLLLMPVKLVWTGQRIFWCMGRGNASESPTGHLISRHGPHASLPFSQETRPQVLGSLHHQSVSQGGSRAGSGLCSRAASTPSRERFPHSAAAMELGAKGTGGMSSPIHEEHLAATWSLGRSEEQEQPDAAVGRVLGCSFHLRV